MTHRPITESGSARLAMARLKTDQSERRIQARQALSGLSADLEQAFRLVLMVRLTEAAAADPRFHPVLDRLRRLL